MHADSKLLKSKLVYCLRHTYKLKTKINNKNNIKINKT